MPYVVFPTLIWAGLRFGPTGASAAVLTAASLTVWNTAHNAGPFVRASINDSLLSTQLFLSTAALTSLVLAAVTAERERSQRGPGGWPTSRRRCGASPRSSRARRRPAPCSSR